MGGHCLVAWDRVASLDLVRLCLGGGFLAVGAFIKLVRVVIAAPRQVDALMPRCPSQQMGLEAAGGVHCIYPGRGVSRFSTPMVKKTWVGDGYPHVFFCRRGVIR